MLELTLAEAIQAMDAQVVPGSKRAGMADMCFPPVKIDSRAVQPKDAFFAIKGDRHDGHSFIPEAVQSKASVVVASDPASFLLKADCLFLKVPDTTLALQQLGSRIRRLWDGPLIAVTGSMGKTTTRRFISTLLQTRFRTHESPGNFNNHIGLPLTLLDLEPVHEVAVVELGMNHAGEIATLSQICQPDVGVLTNVAPVHLEFFDGLEAIAAAKAELLEGMNQAGLLVFNGDDPLVCGIAEKFAGKSFSYGFGPAAEVRVSRCEIGELGRMEIEIQRSGDSVQGSLFLTGRHFAYDVAAAVAVALAMGISPPTISETLGSLRPIDRRGRVLKFDGITIWDDSYNSNPEALKSALKTLSLLPGYRRKILALGDMLELGPASRALHQTVGEAIPEAGVDLLLTVGNEARSFGQGAVSGGLAPTSWSHFSDPEEAGHALGHLLQEGDLLLVKGSRGIGMERIIEVLRGVHA